MTWYMRFYVCVGFFALAILMASALAPSAEAATCANVRCASGSCIDTPGGPVCQANRLTCASTLCVQGTTCVETARGPTCQANTSPPKMSPPYGHTNPPSGPYVHPRPENRPYVRPQPRPYVRPHVQPRPSSSAQSCRLVRTSQYGQSFYRRICEPIRSYAPRRPYTPPKTYYGQRPVPIPIPRPDAVCPQIYAPVCAQKQVQCFRAPCPPVKQTFGNSCEAGNAGYTIIQNGTCR